MAFDSPDGLVSATIGAKEGPGSGYPATLEIETTSTPALFEDTQNGFVGIGIADPVAPLEVNGSALFDSALIAKGSGVFGEDDNAALGVDNASGSNPLRLGFLKQSGTGPVLASGSGNPIVFSQSDQTVF